MNDTDWKERAEKAEAELERVQSFRDRSASIHARTRDKLQNAGVQLSHLAEINASLTNKLQIVLAREAEMRPLVELLECKCDSASNGGYTCPRCHALSSSAGTDYVRKEDVVPVLEAATTLAERAPKEPYPKEWDSDAIYRTHVPYCELIKLAKALAKAKGLT